MRMVQLKISIKKVRFQKMQILKRLVNSILVRMILCKLRIQFKLIYGIVNKLYFYFKYTICI